ncbi:MAG TPA: hypothetical protein VMF65_03770, partial [Acidimicrobiales bacterium]|nr:hypothetical protein [Acidimicrobiales bacterium]
PFSRGDVLAALHREGEVLETVEAEQATVVRAKLAGAALAQFAPFMAPSPGASGASAYAEGTSVHSDASASGEWSEEGPLVKGVG